MLQTETWTLEGALDEISAINDRMHERCFCFLLGAGASVTSGIPSGRSLAEAWINEIYDRNKDAGLDLATWISSGKSGIDQLTLKNIAEFYPQIFERRFRSDKESGYAYLEMIMEGREPSLGYSLLAEILKDTRHKVVVTTNFDNLVSDALAIHAQTSPLIVGHETLTGFVRPNPRRPLVAKIHRDLFYAPKNDVDGVKILGNGWAEALQKIFQLNTPIVIGYGGNDGSLMGFLDSLDQGSIAGRMLWCTHSGSPINSRVFDVVAKHDGVFVPISNFDEFMLRLTPRLLARFDLSRTAQRLERLGVRRADRYRNQVEKIRRRADASVITSETSNANRQIMRRVLGVALRDENNWWTWEMRARSENNIQAKIEIYAAALSKLPNSAELLSGLAYSHASQGNFLQAQHLYETAISARPDNILIHLSFAEFLTKRRERNDLQNAHELYRKALSIDSDYLESIERYAHFLAYEIQQLDEADVNFSRAIKLYPNDPIVTRNYAKFLISEKKDVPRAGEMYRKALSLNPSHAETIGNYAYFLERELGLFNEAEENYLKAIQIDSTVAFIQANYGIFLLIRRNDIDAAEESFMKALELAPGESSYIGNYISLLINHRMALDSGKKLAQSACAKKRCSNNLANLTAVLIYEKKFQEARKIVYEAIEISSNEALSQSLAEIFLYEALLVSILENPATPPFGKLKSLLKNNFVRVYWDFKAVFSSTLNHVPNLHKELFIIVAHAILDRKFCETLDKNGLWSSIVEIDFVTSQK